MSHTQPRTAYAILRKIRAGVVGLGGILANSHLGFLATKQVYDGPLKKGCVPFLNCHACPTAYMSCPVGILQHFSAVRQMPYFLLGFLFSIGMVFGRAACGWLCPFGWIQDALFKIRSRKFLIPAWLKKGKFVSLAVLAVALPFLTGDHWFSRLCSWGTLMAGLPWVLWDPVDPLSALPVIEPGVEGWLPIAGLMSDRPLEQVRTALHLLAEQARYIGAAIDEPFMAMSFMALPVIPDLKLTDTGLVDAREFKVVPLFVS